MYTLISKCVTIVVTKREQEIINMSFPINEDQRIRLSLSERARITIEEDMTNWNINSINSFINIIFEQYKEKAFSSISIVLDKEKAELYNLFSNSSIEKKDLESMINTLLSKEYQKLENKKNEYLHRPGTGRVYRLNNNNYDYITSDICNEQKYYNNRPSQYIRSVIEEYCDLPYIKREEIYHKTILNKINESIDKSKLLYVKTNNNQAFYVEPYAIIPDTLYTRQYLVCYSGNNAENSGSTMASFSISNIASVETLERKYNMTSKKKNAIEKRLVSNSPAYMLSKSELITVKLTKKGQSIYTTKLFNRPQKIEHLSTQDIYAFDCSNRQIFNYFSSMGKEVEILSPASLRKRFKDELQKTLEHYI